MKPIPLALVADPHQVEALRRCVDGRSCVVVGSAPLSSTYADIQPYETTIAVNGGISSLPSIADVWVVNSKAQDKPGALIRPLHKTMLQQGAHRRVGHVLFLRGPKVASESDTLTTLRHLRCSLGTWSVLDKPTKRWIEGELCGRLDDKKPCSSGILAVACALYAGAASVRLVGFSFTPGYHYLPKEKPQSWWRDHVAADRRALATLHHRFGSRLSTDVLQAVAA